ncbi:MAG: 30S ribosomal protein S9 [Nitrospirae bacterium]|nr:30S ribosomal protein S9 [Nitrospirota bacterium]
MSVTQYYATGKRKTAIARVWLQPGDGKVVVNNKKAEEYFTVPSLLIFIKQPLETVNLTDKFNIFANITGGGYASQASALRHGIAKGLLEVDATHRPALKKKGLITRDSREKERKKYGQKGARKKFQFSKR